MTAAADCLFCRVVAGDLPSDPVARTERTYAFRDINPAAPTHILVVPIDHVEDAAALTTADGDLLGEMFDTANKLAAGDGLAERGYRLVLNVGEESGNSVGHLHLHVLGGRAMTWPPG